MSDQQLQALTAKVDQLIALCARLSEENRQLTAQSADWAEERQQLIEKNDVARSRVEAMIERLKALELGS